MDVRYLTKEEIKRMMDVDKTMAQLPKNLYKKIREEAVGDLYDPAFCRKHNLNYLKIRDTDFYITLEIVLEQHHITVNHLN